MAFGIQAPRTGWPLESKCYAGHQIQPSARLASKSSKNGRGERAASLNVEESAVPQELAKYGITASVLFGKGMVVLDHPGNAEFRNLVDRFIASSRRAKTGITDNVIQLVKRSNGRFTGCIVVGEENRWEEVDQSLARKKKAHTFRNRRRYHE